MDAAIAARRDGGHVIDPREDELDAQPAQIGDAEPLRRRQHRRVRGEERGEAEDGRQHVDEIAGERAQHRTESGADAASRGGVQDGERSGAGNQLEDDDGGDEARVVLYAEHAEKNTRSSGSMSPCG